MEIITFITYNSVVASWAGEIYYTQLNNMWVDRLILLPHVLDVLDVAGLIDPFTLRYGHLASLPVPHAVKP